jgi:hypothetical protein
MYTGPDDWLERTVAAAARHRVDRQQVLVFTDTPNQGLSLVALVKRRADEVHPTLAAEYPTASVIDV